MVDRPRTPRPVIVVAAVVALLILPIACTRSGPSTPAVSPAVSAPASSSSIPRTSGPEVRISLFHATHFDGVFALPNGITFANYAGLVKQLRAGLPPDQPSLFLGNGDDVSGDFVIDAFNAAGLDANTYGVNELDFGLERLATLLPRAHYAVVSANVVDGRTGDVYGSAAGARRFVVRELAGVRIGLTGLLTALGPRTIPGSPHGEVLDPAEAMREILPHMRAAGAQLIVVLSHLDTRTEAQQLARAVPGIDLILGTHIGTPRSEPEKVNSTLISSPEWGLTGFGRLDLTLRGGRIASYRLHTYNVSTAAPADPAVAAILNQAGIRPS